MRPEKSDEDQILLFPYCGGRDRRARQEMGPDAMLVNSRKAPPKRAISASTKLFCQSRRCRHAGRGLTKASGRTSDAFPASSAPWATACPSKSRISRRNWKACGAPSPARPTRRHSGSASRQDISDAYAALTAAEVSPELAREIVQAAGDRCERTSAVGRAPQRPDGPAFQRALVGGNLQPLHRRCRRWAAARTARVSSPWSALPAPARRQPWSNSR